VTWLAIGWGIGIGALSGAATGTAMVFLVGTVVGAVVGAGVAIVPAVGGAIAIGGAAGPDATPSDYAARVRLVLRTEGILVAILGVTAILTLPEDDGLAELGKTGGVLGIIVAEWMLTVAQRRLIAVYPEPWSTPVESEPESSGDIPEPIEAAPERPYPQRLVIAGIALAAVLVLGPFLWFGVFAPKDPREAEVATFRAELADAIELDTSGESASAWHYDDGCPHGVSFHTAVDGDPKGTSRDLDEIVAPVETYLKAEGYATRTEVDDGGGLTLHATLGPWEVRYSIDSYYGVTATRATLQVDRRYPC
jgi:hypothetical protein